MTTEAKTAFNLKVLRRHDPTIVDIIDSASFVVLYNHQSEWTKTGVEGPMFLFRRNKAPYHGFFILNRNGVENFSADMTPDDDLEITPEFIIYRPDSSSENDVYGIWIFESSQRLSIGEQMLALQQMASPPSKPEAELAPAPRAPLAVQEAFVDPGAPVNGASTEAASTPQAEPISLDALFGSPAPAEAPVEPTQAAHQASLLNVLFQQAAIQSPAGDTPAASEEEKTGAAGPSSRTEPSKANGSEAPNSNGSAQNLLALLGVKPASDAPDAPAPPSPVAAASRKTAAEAATRAGTDHQGDQAIVPPAASHREGEGSKSTNDQPTVHGGPAQAPKMSDLIADGVKGRIGLGDDGQPLSRREFIRELLSLVHTDPAFVDEIHGSYIEQVSR
ncbi:uncharacterized protein PFL1_05012 [Pseudozyma flocculosa PF-1]|uniref:Related to decapping enzyme n=2 Tax=Pseudozyma flocculosa TaxID=84751 RepID=A0A5C3EWF2_9BASI|nr:uncharacterized protein PFL1_05012 [Pseudozyma flocculosa PF-1]EPQ27474.1 hypothetical protein PFL1_05012 [Pseudozyma flocculosa PF-1]SPO36095.1 related to decapping enzyme [Pseudozyma flocculosa]